MSEDPHPYDYCECHNERGEMMSKAKRTDTERLSWLLNFRRVKNIDSNWNKMIDVYYSADKYRSPRKALDAAMDAKEKGIK